MYTQLLANVTPAVTRVAMVEDGQLVELYIERATDRTLVGNIYKGRVSNIARGMQAAFVDVGLEHDIFLPLSGIVQPPRGADEGPVDAVSAVRSSPGMPRPPRSHPLLPAMEGAPDNPGSVPGPMPTEEPEGVKITDLLKVGQEILVQVVKEPVGTKGARGTTNLTLPGRYLVLMPTYEHIGISRRIEDAGERDRLRTLGEQLKPAGMGLIMRTVAEGRQEEDFRADVDFLLDQWRTIQELTSRAGARTLLFHDSSLLQKIVRDVFSTRIDEFVIDARDEYERVLAESSFLPQTLKANIKLHEGPEPLFDRYSVEIDIERALEPKVWLKSGGFVVIQETEALTSIDVNTGRYLGSTNLEETVFKTNLEAAETIAREVRLRNLAGIIVIDFIDMTDEEHRKRVVERLREAFRRDRIRTNILDLTALGLVEMTRQRHRTTLSTRLKEMCPYCKGEGRILAADYLTSRIFREVQRVCATSGAEAIYVSAHPTVARHILEGRQQSIPELETRYRKKIFVRGEPEYHRETFRVEEKA